MKEIINQILGVLFFALPFMLPVIIVLLLKKFRMFRNITCLLLSLFFDVLLIYVYFGNLYAEFWIPANITFASFSFVFPYIVFIHKKEKIEYDSSVPMSYFDYLDETEPGWRARDKSKIDSYSFRTGNSNPTWEELDKFMKELGPTDDHGNTMYIWKSDKRECVTIDLNPNFDKYYGGHRRPVHVKETKRRYLARFFGGLTILVFFATIIFNFPVTIILASVYVIMSLVAFFIKF